MNAFRQTANKQARLGRKLLLLSTLLPVGAGVVGVTPRAYAQQTTATVVGSVQDASGAAVEGATVKATNTATNVSRETTTGEGGRYALPAIPAGNYVLSVEATGFASARTQTVTLEASQTARQDFSIQVGSVSQQVEVSATNATTQLQVENGGLGEVIDAKKIEDLPLNGRNFIQLAQLIPGVNPGTVGSITVRRGRGAAGDASSATGATAIQVNGQRDTQNRFSIDGIETMDYDAFTFSFSPSIDALSQFRVDTSSSGPESGAAAGANVNVITKTGGNQYHGTLWEFNRNDAFEQDFDALAGVSKAPARLNRNQFGGNIGGPVRIPHIYNGREKTFFFFNYENSRNLLGTQPQAAFVPSATLRTGDLTDVVNGAFGSTKIVPIDPLTGMPFPNNQIPAARLAKAAQVILGVTPTANDTKATSNFLTARTKALSRQTNYTLRVDENLSQRDTLSGHYIHNDTFEAGTPFFANDQRDNDGITTSYQIAYTRVFSSRLVNDFRYGYSKFQEHETFGTSNNKAYDVANAAGIPLASSDPRFYGSPAVTINGAGGTYRVFNGQRNIGPRDRANAINQYVDSLSYQIGKHFVKAVVDFGRRSDFFNQARDPRGTFGFDGRYTGSSIADFLLGYIASDSINPQITTTNLHNVIQGYSVQDNYSFSNTLTLNVGIRYDRFPPYVNEGDLYADIFTSGAPNAFLPDHVVIPSTSPYGRGLLKPSYRDISPRLGFAWQPFGANKLVVRGGYGVYWTPEILNASLNMSEGGQVNAAPSFTGNTGLSAAVAAQKLPNLTFDNPFPGITLNGPKTYPIAPLIDQNLQDEYTQQYNLTIQTALPKKTTLEIAYVGAKDTDAFVSYADINIPAPVDPSTPGLASLSARRPSQTFNRAVTGDFSRGYSNYDALQMKLERRVGQGLTYLVGYTFSKSLSGPADIGGNVGGGTFQALALNPYDPRSDRSLSIFDIPHRFTATVLYDVPFFRHTTGFKKALLDGFQVSTILIAQSGVAATVSDTYQGTATGLASRASVVPGVAPNLSRGQRTNTKVFNTAAFRRADPGSFGNSARVGAIRLPGLINDDISIVKGIKFGEQRNLQLRADVFNAFQHFNPNPQAIGTALNSAATFGVIGNGTSNQFASRIIQLSGKFYF